MKPHNRKLLPVDPSDYLPTTTPLSSSISYSPVPLSGPKPAMINGSAEASSPFANKPINPNAPFDSSMALTILVLVTALFFMAFFSVYIRRFADENPVDVSRRRRNPGSPGLQPSRFAARKGLDSSAVRSLPLVAYGGGGGAAAEHPIVDCVICLAEFEDGEEVKLIPYCRHVFHPECIDTWLASHASCPLCRSTQMFEESLFGAARSSANCGGSDLDGRTVESCSGVEQSSMSRGASDLQVRSTVIEIDTSHLGRRGGEGDGDSSGVEDDE